MKTKSSNSHEESKKVRQLVNSEEKLKGALQGRRSSDGREKTYESDTEEEFSMEWRDKSDRESGNNITGKGNQEVIKKDSEIRSERESEKHSGADGKKREKESDSDEEEEFEEKGSSWHKSYKGDAEIVI